MIKLPTTKLEKHIKLLIFCFILLIVLFILVLIHKVNELDLKAIIAILISSFILILLLARVTAQGWLYFDNNRNEIKIVISVLGICNFSEKKLSIKEFEEKIYIVWKSKITKRGLEPNFELYLTRKNNEKQNEIIYSSYNYFDVLKLALILSQILKFDIYEYSENKMYVLPKNVLDSSYIYRAKVEHMKANNEVERDFIDLEYHELDENTVLIQNTIKKADLKKVWIALSKNARILGINTIFSILFFSILANILNSPKYLEYILYSLLISLFIIIINYLYENIIKEMKTKERISLTEQELILENKFILGFYNISRIKWNDLIDIRIQKSINYFPFLYENTIAIIFKKGIYEFGSGVRYKEKEEIIDIIRNYVVKICKN